MTCQNNARHLECEFILQVITEDIGAAGRTLTHHKWQWAACQVVLPFVVCSFLPVSRTAGQAKI